MRKTKRLNFVLINVLAAPVAMAHEGHGNEILGGALHAFEHPSTWLVMIIAVAAGAYVVAKSSQK